MYERAVCWLIGHAWHRTRWVWFEADDPIDPVWHRHTHPGPMQCARCGRTAPGDPIVIPVQPGWSGVVLVHNVRVEVLP